VGELSWNALETFESRIDRAMVSALRNGDRSGFEIWKRLGAEEGAAGLLAERDLYPTLYRLEAEGLLQSDWHEGEQTRRTYRLTSTALQRAEENGWPARAFQGKSGRPNENARTGRTVSPDPESGSWSVPPKVPSVATAPPSTAPPARVRMGPTGDSRPRSAQPALAPSDGGDVGSAAIARYADEMGAALDLFIVVDRSAAGSAFVAKGTVDLAKLPPYGQWWVVAVATGPSGNEQRGP
jgi:DNA-binding PadR family transcriptional regulator